MLTYYFMSFFIAMLTIRHLPPEGGGGGGWVPRTTAQSRQLHPVSKECQARAKGYSKRQLIFPLYSYHKGL
jgi:hypothetical protein